MPSSDAKPLSERSLATGSLTGFSPMTTPERWLVVDAQGELAKTLSGWVPADEIVAVEDIYQALGELGTQPPFDSLLYRMPASCDGVHQEMLAIVTAMRTLAPGIRLMAVLDAASNDPEDVYRKAGFDVVLVEPLTKESLGPERDGSSGTPSSPSENRQPLQENLNFPNPAMAELWLDKLIHPPTQDGSASPIPAWLGDLDLVEHLLQRAGGFGDLAIRLIREQTGWSHLGFLPSGSSSSSSAQRTCPANHTSLPVEYQGQVMGMLHAPVPADVLTPWAIWLSRWLALQAQTDCLWDFAFKDELTGAWNRRYFNRFLQDILDRATTQRFRVTLMVFDIDDFKQYNDRYGHAAGDEILRETARMIRSEVRKHDVVARIGGDEFAVIFWDANRPRRPNSEHPVDVRQAAQRFQQALKKHKFPKLATEAPGTLTISGGLSGFPWDGRTPDELLAKADDMAMLSKKQGKNAITFGPGVMRLQEPN